MTAARSTVAAPVAPVAPELPDWASPLVTALDVAAPVLPVLVELDWARASPELPEAASGSAETVTPPPFPPLALAAVELLPPVAAPTMTMLRPLEVGTTTSTSPPSPASASTSPPSPPSPPVATIVPPLNAGPVVPESDVETALAPEFAREVALPEMAASPVLPEEPESPEVAVPPVASASPRRAVLTALTF